VPLSTLGVALLVLAVTAGPVAAAAPSRTALADSLYRSAAARLATGVREHRARARDELERAVDLAPRDTRCLLALGELCLEGDFRDRARSCFERVVALAPAEARAHAGLGQVWKRDWLATLSDTSLGRAITGYSAAARAQPQRVEAWLALAPLLFERGQRATAAAAAARAVEADPARAEALLAAAYLEYRSGGVERADSLFRRALPGLPEELRRRFEDVNPLLPEETQGAMQDLGSAGRQQVVERFWRDSDPDPASPENEAQLEYWARIAHAVLLFLDPSRPRWDMRAELYARFGPPAAVAYQPPGVPLARRPNRYDTMFQDECNGWRRVGEPNFFPYHAQVWDYPQLGISVLLHDVSLTGRYQLPITTRFDPNPRPNPRAAAANGFEVAPGGYAAFPALPPGTHPRPVSGMVARFEGARGGRLLAAVETAGDPGDSVWAECVVLDSSAYVVARGRKALSASACDPAAVRAGEFTFDLPPGRYGVALSVRDPDGGRGIFRGRTEVPAAGAALAISDLVLTCGPLDAAVGPAGVRLAPNLPRRVGGDGPLVAYFEVYHLVPGRRGESRFEYEYTVMSEARDRRPWLRRLFQPRVANVSVRTEEEGAGPLRRQFITVPIRSLPPGRYRLEVGVRDRIGGGSAGQVTWFERVK
jgi:GWxTD domain-containing protein